MWEGELKFSLNGVDKGVAHKDPSLTEGEFFFTVIYYELNQEIQILSKGSVRSGVKND